MCGEGHPLSTSHLLSLSICPFPYEILDTLLYVGPTHNTTPHRIVGRLCRTVCRDAVQVADSGAGTREVAHGPLGSRRPTLLTRSTVVRSVLFI